ncbi:hypothetical protein ACIBQ1_60940 [Nonomuraea sp. NPDC050153]|uniref:hypothetical protein n=1 Tax=Nonomuraea sp. NPDC050153 TaxID=3364359 RepID=UPI00379296F1
MAGFAEGDEIFGSALPRALRAFAGAGKPSLGTGSLAEYAVFEADTPLLTHQPSGLSAPDAAALATAGLMARALITTAEPKAGETVLVVGTSGGIGTALMPPLAAAGVRVIATSTAADRELLRRLGAEATIGYEDAYPADVDAAFNLALSGEALAGLTAAVRPGGCLVTALYPAPRPDQVGRDDVDLRLVLVSDGELGGMREVAELAVDGTLPATISRRYTLDEAPRVRRLGPRAHHRQAGRHDVACACPWWLPCPWWLQAGRARDRQARHGDLRRRARPRRSDRLRAYCRGHQVTGRWWGP